MMYRVITAKLKARTGVHIGSGKGNEVTDALIRRDPRGAPFIPGTAIAGALRSLLTRLAPRLGFMPCAVLVDEERDRSCNCEVCHLFGDVNPSDQQDSFSAASRLLVFNAVLPASGQPAVSIRDCVGIDRASKTTARAASAKFDLEVLSPGIQFELRLELQDPSPDGERLLAAGLAEWQAGRMWLGGGVARGLGAFCLTELEYGVQDIEEVDGLMAFLKCAEPWKHAVKQDGWLQERTQELYPVPYTCDTPKAVCRGWVRLTGVLQAEGPLLTNDETEAVMSGFDHMPHFAWMRQWEKPVLTGSGLRGVLRSHAERIARTKATLRALRESEASKKDNFLAHCPACDPNRRATDKNDEAIALENCDSLLKRKEGSCQPEELGHDPEKDLCLACRLFGTTRLGSRLIVEDAPFRGDKPEFKMLDFLAIDRFTGGGAQGAKFDALALWKPAFEISIHLDNPRDWELGWLCLVLRDLADGWLSVGFGSAKGLGKVRLKDCSATFGYLTPEDMPYLPQDRLKKQKSGIYTTVQITPGCSEWHALTKGWLLAFDGELEGFERSDCVRLEEDTYFGRTDCLYPIGGHGS